MSNQINSQSTPIKAALISDILQTKTPNHKRSRPVKFNIFLSCSHKTELFLFPVSRKSFRFYDFKKLIKFFNFH